MQHNRFFLMSLAIAFGAIISPVQADIKVIVNDDLITSMDIQQGIKAKMARSKEMRTALMKQFRSASTKRRWNQMLQEERPTTREEAQRLQKKLAKELQRNIAKRYKSRFRKKVVDDLINERLKYQAAKRSNMLLSDSEMTKTMKSLAGQNKHPKTGKPLTLAQFKMALKSQGVNFKQLKNRLRIKFSWQRYVRSKFRRQVSVREVDIVRALNKTKKKGKSPAKTASIAATKVLKVSFVFPKKATEAEKSKRFAEADKFRHSASSCRKISQKAALQSNVKIKYLSNGMKYAKIRTAVKDRKDGQLSTPVLFNDFVALYTRCAGSKKTVKIANSGDRDKVEKMLKSRAITRLAKRHLRDLRQDANIEYK